MAPCALWAHRALWRVPDSRVAAAGTLGAIAHAAVLLCHTITGLFTTELLALALAIAWWRRRREPDARRRALTIAATLALGVAMASVYIVPALVERKLVRLDALTAPFFSPRSNGVEPGWLLTPFFSPGAPTEVLAAAWLAALAVPSLRNAARAAARWWIPAAIVLLVTMKWLAPIFDVVPFGHFIQFPWRLLG